MIKLSEVVTGLYYGLIPLNAVLIILSMSAANRSEWLVMGATLTGFLIVNFILIGGAIAHQVDTGTKRLERLILKSKDDKLTNEENTEN